MELYLQFGWGMMGHCRELVSKWKGGTVVLSPRDLEDNQLRSLSSSINSLEGGHVLLDPQFYLPRADHHRLCSHEYWPKNFESEAFFQGGALHDLLQNLFKLNHDIGVQAIILPGLLAESVSAEWIEIQRILLQSARERGADCPIYSTIALNADAVRNRDQIAALIEAADGWGADGYYIVVEHPRGEYLVQDPIWLANILDLVSGLRLLGAKAIVGYCNHQLLAASVVRATAICSGTYMNVRSFPPEKFRKTVEEERRKSTWYYCPQSLSEYTVPFLEVAQAQGLLDQMAPVSLVDGGYAKRLFSGPQPSTVGFSEQHAFRHYLHSLHEQVKSLERSSYDESMAAQGAMLDEAEVLLETLGAARVVGKKRDFSDCIDVNRSSLKVLDTLRGPLLRRKWPDLM